MSEAVRVRFAPSPSGSIHLGNARIALINYLYAIKHRGQFLLRVDDTDQKTADVNNIPKIIADLARLGIEVHGAPEYQSAQFAAYRQAAQKLLDRQLAYLCYCSDSDLEKEMRLAKLMKRPPRYSGKCKHLSPGQRQELESSGGKASIRFDVEKLNTSIVTFTDEIAGEVKIPVEAFGDFVLIRNNGVASYNFASVLDDIRMRITIIIRGADHLSNTARQALIWQALGEPMPKFAHVSLLGGESGPLSKRQGDSGVAQVLDRGYLPLALDHYLFSIGNPGLAQEQVGSLTDLAAQFHWPSASGVAQFEAAKLDFFNRAYLRSTSAVQLLELVKLLPNAPKLPEQLLRSYLEVFKDNMTHLSECERAEAFFDAKSQIAFEHAPQVGEYLDRQTVAQILQQLRQLLDALADEQESSWQNLVKGLLAPFQLPKKNLFMGLRLLFTGQTHGPELHKILQLLGRTHLLKRLATT